MTFKDISKILTKYGFRSNNNDLAIQQQTVIDESKIFYDDLRLKYERAYKARKDKFFAEHPDKESFAPTLEEQRRDTVPDEWIYYLFSYLRETPEQIYQEQKMAPLDHDSSFLIRGLDKYDGQGCNQFTGCVPECRYYPETGRIEISEVLEYYKDYSHYTDVRDMFKRLGVIQ